LVFDMNTFRHIFIASVSYFFIFGGIALALPFFSQTQSMVPGQDNLYNIGTTSPTVLTYKTLFVQTASTSNLTVSALNSANCDVKSTNGVFSCGTDATGGGGGSGTGWASTTDAFSIYFTGRDYVGIGTTSPAAKLSVEQGSATTLGMYLAGYANATADLFRISTSTLTSTSTAFVIDSNGKVGVGTSTPYTQMSVAGGIAGDFIQANQTTATSSFAGGALFATGGGVVGVGTTRPRRLLRLRAARSLRRVGE